MKTVAIVQARVGSSRLPRKVLLDLEGKSVLERVLDRVKRCTRIDQVLVATSVLASDDAIVRECMWLGVECFRGSESDVLARYAGAARWSDADVCVRITADCPLIDPTVSDAIIAVYNESGGADYVSNKIPQSFPRGLDTEVFSLDALDRANREARLPYERVHVTPYIYSHPGIFRTVSVTSEVDRAHWRWTIDTPEDLEFVREVYRRFGDADSFGWTDLVALLENEPDLMQINAAVRQKEVAEG